MASLEPMTPQDLADFGPCNFDPLTETYGLNFYLDYLAKWPFLCYVMRNAHDEIDGYILGKIESSPKWQQPTTVPYDPKKNRNLNYLPWHVHITALTVAPRARRGGLARRLTERLEDIANEKDAWFVDLFVRADNINAMKLYKSMGYSVFRKVTAYYADGADAFDMRKSMKRDQAGLHVRPDGEKHEVSPEEVW